MYKQQQKWLIKANKNGIKVLAYEALIQNANLEIFVAFSHLKAGETQGRFLISKVPKGNYMIMYADLPYDTSLKDGQWNIYNL